MLFVLYFICWKAKREKLIKALKVGESIDFIKSLDPKFEQQTKGLLAIACSRILL